MNQNYILCNISTNDSIEIAQTIATYLGVIGTIVIVIIGFKQYKKQKKYDALVGIYCQLLRLLQLFDACLDGANVLNYFCETNSIAENVKTYQRNQFEYIRNEIIELMLHSPNQVPISVKLNDDLLALTKELLYLDGISLAVDKRPILFKTDSEAEQKTKELKELICEIRTNINDELKKY